MSEDGKQQDFYEDNDIKTDSEDDAEEGEAREDDLDDLWQEMENALESSKDVVEDNSTNYQWQQDEDDCDHLFILKDDIGYVCRVCGLIGQSIDTIIDVKFKKARSK